MPELPDVENLKRYLDATALHKEIRGIVVRQKRVLKGVSSHRLKRALTGQSFISSERHGKHLFLCLQNGRALGMHFGMSGGLKYFQDEADDPKHDRMRLSFSNGFHLAYVSQRMLGKIRLLDSVEDFIGREQLGPDALAVDFASFDGMLADGRGVIKSLLMNQKRIAGIGNIYSDEILFQAGIHPRARTADLNHERRKSLFRKMREVLRTGIKRHADPGKMPRTYLLSRRTEGRGCSRCSGSIKKTNISGSTAYYCPSCQRR